MKIVFLSENKTEMGNCRAEFGLSMYIETHDMKLLFDTGASNLFEDNARVLGVDLRDVDACIISHGHFDHTNGAPRFCEINSKAKFYIHENATREFFGTTDGEIDDYNCGILWNQQDKETVLKRAQLTHDPLWLNEDIVISGPIPDAPDFKPVEEFYFRSISGGLEPDTMDHEQFLAVREGENIFLFSGCSHKGIVAAMEYAKDLFPGNKITHVVAGMHLFGATDEMRKKVIDRIALEEPKIVMPMHCTGMNAICMMRERFGKACVLASAGKTYEM